MVTEMFQAFKGASSSTPSGSALPIAAISKVHAPIGGDNLAETHMVIWKEPPSQPRGQQPTKTEEEQPEEPIETKVPIHAIPIYTVTPTPIITTTIFSKVPIPEVTPPRADKGKGSTPVAITIYRDNDIRNFEYHKEFKFVDFSRSKWDELGVIIPTKKNQWINESFPLPKQDPSLPSNRKRKAMELEPETYIVGLQCNRTLSEGVKFMNNGVIEKHEHGLFFTDVFGDLSFQRSLKAAIAAASHCGLLACKVIKSFLCYMRPLIIIDATHLKGTYLGTNLVAVAIDGNNHIIPIATGVSQGETGESWTWFLRKLKDCIGEVPNLAIILDRHYAITLACNTVFPNSFHGYCCRHLMMNYDMKSDKFKELYWKTCKAYTLEDFEKLMSDIQGVRPNAHQKLVDAGVEKWSRAKCPANRYNYMTTNSVESVNALTKDVRKIPITSLMEWFRELLQNWYYEHRQKYEDDIQLVLPPVMDKKLSGRPKNKDLIRSQGEGPIINKCGRCGVKGHNQNSCNVPLPKIQKLRSTEHESSSQGNNYRNESQHEANHDVYQPCEMYEPQHVANYMEDMYYPQQDNMG
ncbi:transposase, MuDR, MULE transposase domain protein [Tanacetum coccineum]